MRSRRPATVYSTCSTHSPTDSRWAPRGLAALGLACALLAPGCTPDDPPAPRPSASRARLLVIGPELARVLVELGVGPEIVAADSISRALPELARAADLGDPAAPRIASARAAGADRALLLADPSDPAAALAETLRADGVPTTLFAPRDADAVIAAIHRLGRVVDRDSRALALAARQTRDVARIATRRDGRVRLRAVWVLDRDPLVVVGGAGIRHQLLELAGAENAFHGAPDPRLVLSPDALAESGADVVLGAPPLPEVPGATPVPIRPALASVPLLDLAGRAERLYALLYPERDAPR